MQEEDRRDQENESDRPGSTLVRPEKLKKGKGNSRRGMPTMPSDPPMASELNVSSIATTAAV